MLSSFNKLTVGSARETLWGHHGEESSNDQVLVCLDIKCSSLPLGLSVLRTYIWWTDDFWCLTQGPNWTFKEVMISGVGTRLNILRKWLFLVSHMACCGLGEPSWKVFIFPDKQTDRQIDRQTYFRLQVFTGGYRWLCVVRGGYRW